MMCVSKSLQSQLHHSNIIWCAQSLFYITMSSGISINGAQIGNIFSHLFLLLRGSEDLPVCLRTVMAQPACSVQSQKETAAVPLVIVHLHELKKVALHFSCLLCVQHIFLLQT